MGFFIDRSEQNGETKIVFTKSAIHYYALYIFFGTGIVAHYVNDFFYIPVFIAAVVMLVFSIPYWQAMLEIKKAMRESRIAVSGSQYSFRNPLTYIIKKKGT